MAAFDRLRQLGSRKGGASARHHCSPPPLRRPDGRGDVPRRHASHAGLRRQRHAGRRSGWRPAPRSPSTRTPTSRRATSPRDDSLFASAARVRAAQAAPAASRSASWRRAPRTSSPVAHRTSCAPSRRRPLSRCSRRCAPSSSTSTRSLSPARGRPGTESVDARLPRDPPLHPPRDGRRLVGRAHVPALARRRDGRRRGWADAGRRAAKRRPTSERRAHRRRRASSRSRTARTTT